MENGIKVDAFASDAVIVQTLFQKGVNEEGQQNMPYYQKYRPPYKDTPPGFVVFPSKAFPSPSGEYLPYLGLENYAIAVRKQDSAKWLDIIDNHVLVDLNDEKSNLAKAKAKIEPFEQNRESTPINIFNSTITPRPTIPPKPNPNPPDNDRWIPIVVALIAAFASIIVAILNPQFFGNIIDRVNGRQSSQRTVTGRVLNAKTGEWIRRAKVSLEVNGIPLTEFTDSEGVFEFSFQSSGSKIMIRVEADGYEMFDKRIDISTARAIQDIRLSPNL